ncbi:GIN domain-containing protein [Pedobacter fastidiosus]|uniref:DUF2807 domain-containing protein n=1 Tax=Pedobacter fastidiosus TaxID=2765361 RepID=A0ABR7KVD1_9SPHI|nr:DUF2807 domain-containing protein [Pedobacter fastidiosus]MBC6111712.1 DUF2807 domain-containing protein [Pedobacter fastidiosus]
MKTSNKLLIALAALLIIIPVIAIAVIVKINFVPSGDTSYLSRQELNNQAFDEPSKGRLSIPIPSVFNAVNFVDAKNSFISVHLTKSTVSGVKITSFEKEFITLEVKNGVLNLSFNDNFNQGRPIDIVIYAPSFKKINASNAGLFELVASGDSLEVDLHKTESFSFGAAIITRNNKGETIKVINQSDIKNLIVNLNDSKFSSFSNSYQNLEINTKGNSEIELNSGENNKEIYTIKNLSINTVDTASINIKNIKIEKIKGKISDNTIIKMPIPILKQLFKN